METLTCWNWRTRGVGASEVFQMAFERVWASDTVAGVSAAAKGASVFGEGETVGAKHSAGVVCARLRD